MLDEESPKGWKYVWAVGREPKHGPEWHPDDAQKREFITTARPRKLWAPAVPGPNSVPPPRSLPDRVDAFGHQDGDAAEEAKI